MDTGAPIDAIGRQNLRKEDQKRAVQTAIQHTFDTAGGPADANEEVHFDLKDLGAGAELLIMENAPSLLSV